MWDLIADIGKALWKWGISLWLSREEKLMLVRALPSGEIYLVDTGQAGKFVRPGDYQKDQFYFDQNDRALQERSITTLEKLIERKLVRHDAGQLYRLTAAGFDRARKLQRKMKVD